MKPTKLSITIWNFHKKQYFFPTLIITLSSLRSSGLFLSALCMEDLGTLAEAASARIFLSLKLVSGLVSPPRSFTHNRTLIYTNTAVSVGSNIHLQVLWIW